MTQGSFDANLQQTEQTEKGSGLSKISPLKKSEARKRTQASASEPRTMSTAPHSGTPIEALSSKAGASLPNTPGLRGLAWAAVTRSDNSYDPADPGAKEPKKGTQ